MKASKFVKKRQQHRCFPMNTPVHQANICWASRRVEDVFNTSSAQQFFVFQDVLQISLEKVFKTYRKKSWKRLKDIWEGKKLLREDVLKTSCKYFFKTSWRHLATRFGRRKIVTLKTPWSRLEDMPWRSLKDMSWRRLEDKQNVYWGNLYLTITYKQI